MLSFRASIFVVLIVLRNNNTVLNCVSLFLQWTSWSNYYQVICGAADSNEHIIINKYLKKFRTLRSFVDVHAISD